MSNWLLISSALLGGLAVACGAFGAHALQGLLTAKPMEWYGTAVTYHTTHALAMFGTGILVATLPNQPAFVWLRRAGLGFLAGVLVFSGSLYLMAFTGITKLGMITPIGGLLLILAWLSLAIGSYQLQPRGK